MNTDPLSELHREDHCILRALTWDSNETHRLMNITDGHFLCRLLSGGPVGQSIDRNINNV